MPDPHQATSTGGAAPQLHESELVQALRYMIDVEKEAVQLYERLAAATENATARNVLIDIIREEKAHVGEFRLLLALLSPQARKARHTGI